MDRAVMICKHYKKYEIIKPSTYLASIVVIILLNLKSHFDLAKSIIEVARNVALLKAQPLVNIKFDGNFLLTFCYLKLLK